MILDDKVVLVTGAAQGIGLAIAHSLAAEGARIAILDSDGDRAELAAESIGPREKALAVTVDVRDRDSLAVAIEVVATLLGGIDIVIANAGVAPDFATFRAGDPADFDRVIDINLGGTVNVVRATLRHLVRSKGHLVLISSVYAFNNGALQSSYAISKAAIEQFGRALRLELKTHDVGVTIAYFGFVDTSLVAETWTGEAAEAMRRAIPSPLRAQVTPEQAAWATTQALKRGRQVVVRPRRWRLVLIFRGIYAPIADRVLTRDRNFAVALASADQAELRR